jgi:mannose-6-phosphate isomerase-like protein (cupin superfamily)
MEEKYAGEFARITTVSIIKTITFEIILQTVPYVILFCSDSAYKTNLLMTDSAEKPTEPAETYHSQKDRVFVRPIQGAYNLTEELERLRAMPRVRKAKEIKFIDGPQTYSRHYVEPKHGITQTFHLHLEEYGPGGRSQKHGHVNEAAFYILDGEGYEIHDGERYGWKAGDIAIVHNNCVHQHFNASDVNPARALVIKTKPMFMFMNMLFQKQVIPRPSEPAPGGENFSVREEEDDFNHPKGGY